VPDCVIMLSAGRTDVQVIGETGPRSLTSRNCRQLHDELLAGFAGGRVTLADSPPPALPVAGRPLEIECLPSGSFCVCTPKLDGLIEAALAWSQEDGGRILGVIVLQTNRSSGAFFNAEPHGVGKILGMRALAKIFPDVRESSPIHLNPAISLATPFAAPVVGWLDVVTEEESLEGPDDQDFPVARRVADRINALTSLIAASFPGAVVAVSTKGGPPPLKEVIESSIAIHLGNGWRPFEQPEGRNTRRVEPARAALWGAAGVLHSRRHAMNLIDRGDFRGAYSAGSHLIAADVPAREHDHGWLTELDQVARWMDGFDVAVPNWFKDIVNGVESKGAARTTRRTTAVEAASRVPPVGHALLRTAWKAEASLRSRRIPEALGLTGTFLDAALLDAIRVWAVEVDPEEKVLVPPDDPVVAELRSPQTTRDGKSWRCLRPDNGYWMQGPAVGRWLLLLNKTACGDFNARYAGGNNPRPVDLRNHVMHGFVSSQFLARAEQKMAAKELWTRIGFLASPQVRAVLSESGITDADRAFSEIIDALRRSITNARL